MSEPIDKKNDLLDIKFDVKGLPIDISDGSYIIASGNDYATVTLSVRLKYHSEHHEDDEVLPEQKHPDPELELLRAAVERYVCGILDGRTPHQCQLLKPQVHEFQYRGEVSDDDQPSTTSPANSPD